jgi:hypothetical protein
MTGHQIALQNYNIKVTDTSFENVQVGLFKSDNDR